MKLNKNIFRALTLACAISIPMVSFARPMTLPEFIISYLLPDGSLGKPETVIPNERPEVEVPHLGGTTMNYEKKVLELVNKERTSRGLSALQMHSGAQNVARIKSQDMQKKNYFDHVSPTYGTPFEMLKSFGVSYTMAGENIAAGYTTPEEVVTGWMNSPGHRKNILTPEFTHMGVGYEPNGHYWTQMFIR